MELFKELTQLHGVSGYEREVRAYIKDKMAPYADELIEDAIGNLIVFKKGTGAHKKRVQLCAHMDEIGLQVIKIEQDGRIMVKSMGCSWMYTTYQSRVRFRNGITGVVASRVRPEDINGQFTNLYVDIGVTTREEVMEYVDVGDVAIYEGPFEELAGDYVTAKAIDDRVGCYMQMKALMEGKEFYNDAYFVFTVQEEVGCRGSHVTAHRIKPDIGVAIDITPGMNFPGDLEGNNTPGNGAAIKISDTSVICDEYLVEKMIACAKRDNIKYQKDVIYVGGTDASSMNLSNDGVKACAISIVTRYSHGPNAIACKADIRAAIDLIKSFLNEEFEF